MKPIKSAEQLLELFKSGELSKEKGDYVLFDRGSIEMWRDVDEDELDFYLEYDFEGLDAVDIAYQLLYMLGIPVGGA